MKRKVTNFRAVAQAALQPLSAGVQTVLNPTQNGQPESSGERRPAQTCKKLLSRALPLLALLLLAQLPVLPGLQAQITGTVFRDYNGNGTQDANEPFMPGVTVNAYDAANTLCGTATTVGGNTAPNYSLTGCGTGPVRVEFVLPAAAPFVAADVDYPSLGGVNHGTSVQFVNGNSSNVNYAIHDPDDYNTGPADVDLYIPCYVNGDPLPAGSSAGMQDWFVGFPYTNGGIAPPPALKVGGSIIGATWGVAYSNQANRIFTSAFIKRHVGLGTLGSGGIYMLEPTATSFNATAFYDLDANGHRTRAAAGAVPYGEGTSYALSNFGEQINFLGPIDPVSGEVEGVGVVGSNAQRGLDANYLLPNYDATGYDQIGKAGLGGLEISDDGRFLFVMNLYSKSVYRLELNDPFNPTSVVNVTEIDLPAVTCNNGVFRPFALTYHRGQLFAGGICSGENGGARSDLFAYVFRMDNANTGATFSTSPVLSQSLDYYKGPSYRFGDFDEMIYFNPWTNNVRDASTIGTNRVCPMLTDFEFANNGQMIVNFSDRTGHQFTPQNYKNLASSPALVGQMGPGGEIWVAGLDASTGTYQLENAGLVPSNGILYTSTMPVSSRKSVAHHGANYGGLGGIEFFHGDYYGRLHSETALGSSVYLAGQADIQQVVYDPHPQRANAAGIRKLNLADGAADVDFPIDSTRFYQIYEASGAFDGIPAFGKANGLGEIELLGFDAPLEIGNRIWVDANENGIQDPDEAPIPGIEVQLWKDDGTGTFTQIATVTTAADGTYYFSSATGTSAPGITYNVDMLLPAMNYELRFPTSATIGPDVFSLTSVNMGGTDPNADARDSDADMTTGVVPLTTAADAGANDHSFDVGYRVAVANLEMEKTFVSATPNGDGTFTVDYTITVTETNGIPTIYDLTDTPGFDDDITINSGNFTGQNTGPLSAGTNTLATNEAILANATHTYNLSFNVTLDLTDGNGDDSYTPCDGTTPIPGQGLYNLATITTAGMSGDDDACGDLSVITHEKALASVSTINGDGSYDVSYTITVSHVGGIAGQYDLNDIPNFDNDFTINNANYSSSAPPGLSGPLSTTMGATNILGDDVPIAIGDVHTYTLNFNISLDLTDGTVGDDLFTSCGTSTPGTPQAGEGLFNQSTLDINNDGIPDEIEEVCTLVVCPSGNCGNLNVQND